MVAEITIRSGDEDIVARIEELLEDPKGLLNVLGAYFVQQAHDSFRQSRLDEFQWAEQYPSQEEPFVHIAGLVSDANKPGRAIADRRFSRGHPLVDTGILRLTLSDEKKAVGTEGKHTVTVGVAPFVDYADNVFFGGTSEMPITEGAKDKIRDFIESPEGEPYFLKLAWLTGETDTLETQVNPRPFFGITAEARKDVPEIVEEWVVENVRA